MSKDLLIFLQYLSVLMASSSIYVSSVSGLKNTTAENTENTFQ